MSRGFSEDVSRIARELAEKIREAVEASLSVVPPTIYGGYRRPITEIRVENGYIYLLVELPGCGRDNISLTVEGREVEVEARYSDPPFPEMRGMSRYRDGGFRRRIDLPHSVDTSDIQAKYADGVLYLRLKLAQPSGTRVKIE